MAREDAVAEVSLAGVQPWLVAVDVDPSHHGALDLDAVRRRRLARLWTQPTPSLVVPSIDDRLSVGGCVERSQGDHAIQCEVLHAPSLLRTGPLPAPCIADPTRRRTPRGRRSQTRGVRLAVARPARRAAAFRGDPETPLVRERLPCHPRRVARDVTIDDAGPNDLPGVLAVFPHGDRAVLRMR